MDQRLSRDAGFKFAFSPIRVQFRPTAKVWQGRHDSTYGSHGAMHVGLLAPSIPTPRSLLSCCCCRCSRWQVGPASTNSSSPLPPLPSQPCKHTYRPATSPIYSLARLCFCGRTCHYPLTPPPPTLLCTHTHTYRTYLQLFEECGRELAMATKPKLKARDKCFSRERRPQQALALPPALRPVSTVINEPTTRPMARVGAEAITALLSATAGTQVTVTGGGL